MFKHREGVGMVKVLTGEGEEGLNVAIREHFNPGSLLYLDLSLPRPLTREEAQKIGEELAGRGIDVRSVASSGNTLRIKFVNPPSVAGYALAWLPILAILGGLGITGYLTWKVGTIPEAIARNIVPVTAMVVGATVLIAYILSRKPVTK